MNNLRIAVLSPERQQLDEIQKTLLQAGDSKRITTVEATLEGAASHARQLAADILIAACDGTGDGSELAPLGAITFLHPEMQVILVCRGQAPAFLLQAMRMGVREVLAAPLDAAALQAALDRLQGRFAATPAAGGKVYAFTSCKGGSGSSFLASNLAYALSLQGEASVALIDFNLHFGDAHMLLTDREPERTLSDVMRNMHRLDAALLNASMTRLNSKLAILAAPNDPSAVLELRPEHVDALLATARTQFDYVFLDVGRTVDGASVRALDQADLIYPVMQPTVSAVHGAKRMLGIFDSLEYPDRKVALVVNRYKNGGELGIVNMEQALGRPIAVIVPNDYSVAAAAADQGEPVVRMAQDSTLSRSIQAWSGQLLGKQAEAGGSWVSRLLRRRQHRSATA